MLWITFIAFVLVAITVIIHSVGLAVLLQFLLKAQGRLPTSFWAIVWLLLRVTWWLILIHLVEILVWGLFYYWRGCIPGIESALYFSGVTYATIGYGDLVLPQPWRLFGPVEGLTGILMCGLSAGIFFAVVNRIFSAWAANKQKGLT
jgi:hypothetical protein